MRNPGNDTAILMHERGHTGRARQRFYRYAPCTLARNTAYPTVQSAGNRTSLTSPRFHSSGDAVARQRISSSPNTSTRFVSTKPSFPKSAMLGAFCMPIRATRRVRGIGGMLAGFVFAPAAAVGGEGEEAVDVA